MELIDRKLLSQFDWLLLILAMLIPLAGLIVLYSAGYDPDSKDIILKWIPGEINSIPFEKQLFFLMLGMVAVTVGVLFPSLYYHRLAYVVYALCLILLVAVLIPGIGVVSNGSRRWIPMGFFNLQPAEFMKIGLILAMAKFLSRHLPPAGGYKLLQLIGPLIIIGIPMALIAKQPDLGSALSLAGIGCGMLLFVGVNYRSILLIVLVIAVSAYPVWHSLHAYQQRRVMVLFNPDVDPKGSGYHIAQSKIAVGSGQIFGKGFLNGTQTQLEFLPEHTTDFIFSVLAEEWGFVGCLLVLGLYFAFLLKIMRVIVRSKDLFSAFVTVGVGTWFFFHVFINIGMVVGVLPVVGIPLPMFSYGGSALMSSLFSIGIILGFVMRRSQYV